MVELRCNKGLNGKIMIKVLGICGLFCVEFFNLKFLYYVFNEFGGDYEIGLVRMFFYDGDFEDFEGVLIVVK